MSLAREMRAVARRGESAVAVRTSISRGFVLWPIRHRVKPIYARPIAGGASFVGSAAGHTSIFSRAYFVRPMRLTGDELGFYLAAALLIYASKTRVR